MKVLVRFRVDKRQMEKANKVTEQLGTSTPEMIRIFLAEIARTGKVPVSLQARTSTEEDEALGPIARRREMLDYFHDA